MRPVAIATLTLGLMAASCSGDDSGGAAGPADSTTTTTTEPATTTTTTEAEPTTTTTTLAPLARGLVALSGQGNDLVAYDLDGNRRLVIENARDNPDDGLDINAQVCFLDDRTFIAGEDTGQPDIIPGWGIFELVGDTFTELSATQVGKLVPTYQPAGSQPEMFGCGVLPDGRIVTTDVGNQASGPGTGQLMLWFPPIEGTDIEFCMVDIDITTAQSIAIDGDDVLVASARPPTAGVWRYTDLPTGPTPEEGCDGIDVNGSPMVTDAAETLFIDPADGGLGLANGLAASPHGWYVSGVFTGVINEYEPDGSFRREILRPPEGESILDGPYSTGTPNGIAVTDDGTIWFADLALTFREGGGIGPGAGVGTVRIIRFVDGEPQPPEIIDEGLAFPDAISIIP